MKQVTSLAFSINSLYLASGSQDSDIKIWDILTKQELVNVKMDSGSVIQLAFTADGKYMISFSDSYYVKQWNIQP